MRSSRNGAWCGRRTSFGSIAFLVSGVLGIVAVTAVVGLIELKARDWQAEWVNMIGCVAFGVSALGAFVTESGVTADALLANAGTFVGALCFLVPHSSCCRGEVRRAPTVGDRYKNALAWA